MSELSELSTRVRLGWASEWEKQRVKDLTAEEDRNWQQYHNACQERREQAEATIARAPTWMRDMSAEDYIHNRRMCQERESFDELRQRTTRKT